MPNRTRPSNPKKRIQAKALGVKAQLKSRLIGVLQNEFANSLVGVPHVVTGFPRATGPRFKVTLTFQPVAAAPKSNK